MQRCIRVALNMIGEFDIFLKSQQELSKLTSLFIICYVLLFSIVYCTCFARTGYNSDELKKTIVSTLY